MDNVVIFLLLATAAAHLNHVGAANLNDSTHQPVTWYEIERSLSYFHVISDHQRGFLSGGQFRGAMAMCIKSANAIHMEREYDYETLLHSVLELYALYYRECSPFLTASINELVKDKKLYIGNDVSSFVFGVKVNMDYYFNSRMEKVEDRMNRELPKHGWQLHEVNDYVRNSMLEYSMYDLPFM